MVWALAVSENNVYAAGRFTQICGDATCTGIILTVNRIGAWSTTNNAWEALASGVDNQVLALAMNGGELYAGGYFVNGCDDVACSSSTRVNHIAKFVPEGPTATPTPTETPTLTATDTPTPTNTPTLTPTNTPTATSTGVPGASADVSLTNKVKKVSATSHKYTLKVTNTGPDAATNVVVSDKLPKHYVVNKASGKGASCVKKGLQVTCTIATLNAGAGVSISIKATASGAKGRNCATVASGTSDPNAANNKACANVPRLSLAPTAPEQVAQVVWRKAWLDEMRLQWHSRF